MKKFRLYTLLALLLMAGGATMQAQVRQERYDLLPNAYGIKTEDVNGDGYSDVVISHGGNSIISVFLNDGSGHLELSQTIEVESDKIGCFPMFFLLEDIDNNKLKDIVVYVGVSDGLDTCYLRTYYNNVNGHFDQYDEVCLSQPDVIWDNPYFLVMTSGHFNNDAYTDVIVSTNYLNNGMQSYGCLYNDGQGRLLAPEYAYGEAIGIASTNDLNEDGYDDIWEGNQILYFSEEFPPRLEELYEMGNAWDGCVTSGESIIDIDGDGLLDLVESRTHTFDPYSQLRVYKNLGEEHFELMSSYDVYDIITPNTDIADNLKIMNYNGDDYPDFIVQIGVFEYFTGFTGYYLIVEGNGTFAPDSQILFNIKDEDEEMFRTFDVCDINSDGLDDLLVLRTYRNSESQLDIYLNDGNGFDAIEEVGINSNVTCSPNPVNDYVYINGIELAEVQVYNTFGQLVKTVRNSNEVSLEGLPQGVYLLRITDMNGIVYTNKITVQ